MSNEFIIFLFLLGIVAISFQAYNMGWQSGHDIHHDDSMHGPNPPKNPDKTLWV